MDPDKDQTSETKQPPSEDIPPKVGQTQTVEEDQPPPMEKSNKKLFKMGAIISGVIIILAVGFFLTQRKNITQPEQTPKPTSTPAVSPTTTPKPSFNRSEWSLEVLNGSGVTGAAKKLADKLAELGYKILKTGNADRSDYAKSELFVAKDRKDKQDSLLEDLKKELSIASVSGELTDSTASARIFIGKE